MSQEFWSTCEWSLKVRIKIRSMVIAMWEWLASFTEPFYWRAGDKSLVWVYSARMRGQQVETLHFDNSSISGIKEESCSLHQCYEANLDIFDSIPSLRNFAHCLVHHRTFRFENLEVLSTYREAIQVQRRVRIIS